MGAVAVVIWVVMSLVAFVAVGFGVCKVFSLVFDEINAHPRISLSPASGPAGTVVTVTGKNFGGGETIRITFGATSLATTTANADGSFSAQITIPDNPLNSASNPFRSSIHNTISATAQTNSRYDSEPIAVTVT